MLSAPRPRATTLIVATLALLGTSCAVTTDASGWDDPKAKAHFLATCQGDTRVGNATTTVVPLASEEFCGCVFEDLTTKHKLAWEDLLEYEKRQADAKDGELPDPPTQVTQAIEACQRVDAAGPTVPDAE